MSNKIDQRIVEMSFENHKFEKGILQSKKSLKDFSSALRNMDPGKEFNGLDRSVQSLSSSFSILEEVGVGALRRIGEMAVNAGASLIKNLTIDQLSSGLTKYEQKLASVQTIMNATGKDINEVNAYLDKLMWFSDETSYGFTDMTAALAQMTSSGGDIDKLIPMITGVANATAYAGKGATEFSRAMYNLNQSYGRGNLEYMDWKSLELAGVAGKDLKQIFIDTGKALGTLDANGRTAKGTLVDIGTFGATLQEKWANTKVMETAFSKFSELSEAAYELVKSGEYETAADAMASLAGQYSLIAEKAFKSAQQAKSFTEAFNATMDAVSSGWMRTYEIIFGELDEATANFTKLTEILWTVFAAGAEGRNEMLQSIKDAGGVADAFQTIKNVATALLKPLQAISKGLDQIFPPRTTRQWMRIITALKSFSEHLLITDETASKIQRTFAGFFAVIDIGWTGVKFLGNAFLEIVKTILPVGDSILDITASIGDFLVMVNRFIKSSGAFQYGLLAIKVVLFTIKEVLTTVIGNISNFINVLWTTDKPLEFIRKSIQTTFGNLIDLIKMGIGWISNNFINALSNASKFISDKFGTATSGAFSGILEVLKSIIDLISDKANFALQNLSNIIRGLDLNKIASFVIGGTLLLFVNQITHLSKSMSLLTDNASGFIKNLSKKLFGSNTKIKDMAYAIGVLSASLYVLSRIPWNELKNGLIGLGGAISIFVLAYAGIQTVNVIATKMLKNKEIIKSAFNLVSLASGLAIMAGALKIISGINDDEIWRSVGVVGALVGFLTIYQGAAGLISTFAGGKLSISLMGMTSGLLLLIGVIKIINNVQEPEIASALNKISEILITIGSIQLLFSAAAALGGGNKLTTSVLGMASGILVLIGVIKLINNVSNTEILNGMFKVSFIGTVIAGLQALFASAAMFGDGKKSSVRILAIAGGVVAMLGLIKLVNLMTADEILMGTIKISFMMAMLAAMQALFATANNIGKGNISLAVLSATASMTVLTGLIAIINVYTPEQILKGLATIAAMAALVGAIQFFAGVSAAIGDGNKAAAGILSITVLLAAMTGAIALLSVIPTESLQAASNAMMTGAISIGIIIAALSLFSQTAQNSIGQMIGLAASLVIFAGAIALMTLPMIELSKLDIGGLAAGVIAVSALIGVFAGLTILFNTLNVGTASLIGLAGALVIFGAAITLLSIPMSVLSSFDSSQIITTTLAFAGLLAVFTAMGFLNSGGVLAMGMITAAGGVAAFGASLIVVAGAIALAGVGFKFGAEAFDILVNAFGNLLNIVDQNRDTLVEDFKILGTAIGEGVFSGIKSFFGNIGKELQNVWETITNSVKNFFGIHSPSVVMAEIGSNVSGGLWNGIKDGLTNIKDNIGTYLSGITDKISGVVGSIAPVGKEIVSSIGNGIKRNGKAAVLAGINMAQNVEGAIRNTFQVHSESPLYASIGEWVPNSIVSGFKNGKTNLVNKAKELGIDTSSITVEGIAEGLANGEGAITSGITSLLELLNGKKSITDIVKDAGIEVGETFAGSYADSLNVPATKAAYGSMAKDAFTIFKESIDYRKEYNLISLEEELAEWENFARKYSLGSETRMKADKEVARVRDELDTKSFEHSKKWIENEKYYKRLSLLEELAAWERVQKRYAEGHVYRMQAERELFRLKEELKKAEYQNSLDWIDQEKYYKRLSLGAELAAWKRVQARYKKFEDDGTKSEERKQTEREIYRVEQEITEKRKQLKDDFYRKEKEINDKLIDDIRKLNDEYDDALKSRTKSLTNAWGLFDEVSKSDQPTTGKQLLSNLEGQVVAFSRWQDQLDALRGKGVSDILIKELEDMGPTSLEQIKALNQLSGPELDRYVILWQKKHRQARTQATSELVDLRRETDQQIVKLTKEADIELESYRKVWRDSLAEIGYDSVVTTTKITKNVLTALTDFATSVIPVFKTLNSDVTETVQNGNWEETGKQVTTGLAKGITLGSVFVLTAMRVLTSGMKKTTEQELEIHSPSRVGIGIGENYAKSIGSGMLNMLKHVTDPSENLAVAVVDAMSNTLSGINDILDYDYDLQPTIIPVLDMRNVDVGLDRVFNASRKLELSNVAIKSAEGVGIQEIYSTVLRQRKLQVPNDNTLNNTVNNTDESVVQIINNYSVRNDHDIRKISRDQKNLLDRYNLARGVTN